MMLLLLCVCAYGGQIDKRNMRKIFTLLVEKLSMFPQKLHVFDGGGVD